MEAYTECSKNFTKKDNSDFTHTCLLKSLFKWSLCTRHICRHQTRYKDLLFFVVSSNIFVASMLGVSSNIFVASMLGIGSGNVLGLSKFVMGGSTGVIVEFIVFIAAKEKRTKSEQVVLSLYGQKISQKVKGTAYDTYSC